MSCCNGCKERYVGCKSTCEKYVVQEILEQPTKEKIREEKDKALLLSGDLNYRQDVCYRREILRRSPVKCKKR